MSTTQPDPSTEAFESIVGSLDYPMFIVTTAARGTLAGCLVGFASQISIDPPRFLVGLSYKNRTYRITRSAEYVAVQVLPSECRTLAKLFGESTSDDVDKFSQCLWHQGPNGLPILDEAAAWFAGRILERLPFGDHAGLLVAPEGGHAPERLGELITFSDVREFDAGHGA